MAEPVAPDSPAAGAPVVADVPPVPADDPAVRAVLERAVTELGLSSSIARLALDAEQLWERYEEARNAGRPNAMDAKNFRQQWLEVEEMKRKMQPNKYCVALALQLLKDWVRAEWEPVERERRSRMSGRRGFLPWRAEIQAAQTDADFCAAIDKAVTLALADAEEGGDR